MKTRISVYQSHIDKGCPRSGNNCPVAKATLDSIADEFKSWNVTVTGLEVILMQRNGGAYIKGVLPKGVSDSIKLYDSSGIMHPMEFDVEFRTYFYDKADPSEAEKVGELQAV